jgi:hypothetical protein
MGDGLEILRAQPALRLLVDCLPAREVMRQHAPLRPGADQPAQAVVDFTQVVFALQGVRRNQAQVGRDERPFIVGDIGWVGLACTYTPFYPTPMSSS